MKAPDPKAAAEEILQQAWPEGTFPVDPVRIANRLGIKVVMMDDLDSNVSGALIKEQGDDPVIVINASQARTRQRFTCAHELGHYYCRSNEEAIEFVDLRSNLSSAGVDGEEIFANQFAANLLMPEDAVRKLYDQGVGHISMAMTFGVSGDAMGFRLKNLGLE